MRSSPLCEHVKRELGAEVICYEQSWKRDDGEGGVVRWKKEHPTFEDRPYGTHWWTFLTGYGFSLELGHYDLDEEDARTDYENRRKIGG